jgi:hypothetical protein
MWWTQRKYRLAKWSILPEPKSLGGLGIDLDIHNKCLVSKWIFKHANEEGLWKEILKNKYLNGTTLSQVERKKGDSWHTYLYSIYCVIHYMWH